MTKAKHELSWNSDVKIPNGKPKGGFKSQNGFTINTGVVNQIDNEPVSPEEVEKEIKVTDRDIGVLFPSLLFKSRVSDRDFLSSVKERILKATKDKNRGTVAGDPKDKLVPDTVPTIALALLLSEASSKAITNVVSVKRAALPKSFMLV